MRNRWRKYFEDPLNFRNNTKAEGEVLRMSRSVTDNEEVKAINEVHRLMRA